MKTITRKIYEYQELTPEAQQRARGYYHERFEFIHDHVYADAVQAAGLFGLDIAENHKTKSPVIYFSGFYSQGDGAAFSGDYKYSKGALDAVKAYAPCDEELHRIVAELQSAQRNFFYRAEARVTTQQDNSISVSAEPERAETALLGPLQDFADWIHKQLRVERDYQTSDDYIAERFDVNSYYFYASGALAPSSGD